ncbi:hypothetical protein C8A05DRAFT_44535 [Staphylotrichum tortipilum]|uniref:Small ribosomal subunit protein uS10m n=1 Tax=Staphylotrichum tortipilum TaxID=2831512 RepID=A0AAN6MJ97_9PEZI|nr:hypothetical protein C8A05DRAFT_44535 [Staphylotrichum longicolle]
MATTLGLSDDEIDRLLSEAEARLSGNDAGAVAVANAGSADALTATPPAKALASAATPVASTAGEQTAVPAQKPGKLTVRVPQPTQKKKDADTLGPAWFNMPRTNLTPELKRDLQALRMRDVAAMGKQFFKKDSRKDLVPEYSQVGTIIAGATDGVNNRLTRKERKQTIVEEILAGGNVTKLKSNIHRQFEGDADMNPPRLIRPLRPLLQGQLPQTAPRSAAVGIARASPQLRTYASVAKTTAAAAETEQQASSEPTGVSRMPRALEALYLQPLRREAEYGVPSCDLQMRSYSARNLEFFADFALRAAYFLGLPAFGPVPLPRMVERWTVPKSSFIFKKSQENFERITLRRLIQIRDGHPETVQVWLAFLQKHAYYGVGMKVNLFEFSKLGVGKEMDKQLPETEKLLADQWEHLGYVERRPEHQKKDSHKGPREQLPAVAELEEFLASERRRISGGRKIIFSAIQPTGVPHLGNYLGALREWKRLQNTSPPSTGLIFSVADLHAITVPRPPETVRQHNLEALAALRALGLNQDRSTVFLQSAVPCHAELQWILSCTASTGYLSRMTQWKHGLFSYPVLQAADILLYRATHVPVGSDQRQHLEFARECAINFNSTYQTDFMVKPEAITACPRRIMSLKAPTCKMSKSDPSDKSRILITDSPEIIEKRIHQATTDSIDGVSYDPDSRPGVSNLLDILAALDPKGRTPAALAEEMSGYGCRELKMVVTQVVTNEFADVRERFQYYMAHPKELADFAEQGRQKAMARAQPNMDKIRSIVGLV